MEGQDNTRYARQKTIPQIGEEGQRKLSEASVLVVGGGGLGSPLLYALAGAGVGHLTIADGDKVSLSNLNRQCLYTEGDVGARRGIWVPIRQFAPPSDIAVTPFSNMVDAENCGELVAGHDLVLLAVDSIPTRLLVNDFCKAQNIPLISGGIDGFFGDVLAVEWGKTPDLHTLYDGAEQGAPAGALGAVAGVIASLMANLAILQLLGRKSPLGGSLLTYDGLTLSLESVAIG
ncbi:MAG: HesA/MoeB/ThiF family protein [Oscillospiraceae bacterium]